MGHVFCVYLSQHIFRPTKSYWPGPVDSDLSSFELEGSNILLSSCLAVSLRSVSFECLSNNTWEWIPELRLHVDEQLPSKDPSVAGCTKFYMTTGTVLC